MSRRHIGALLLAGSALMARVIHAHPEGMRAPAWVVFTAIACFGLAGLVLLAEGHPRAWRVALPLLVACLLVPPLRIAFGAANPQCGVSILGAFGIAPAWACRGAFGFSALVLLAILAIALRRPR